MKKAVIEDPSVELLELFDRVSQEAKTEKNAVPPINKMIYWWTRKPLVVGRAMILASTLQNIDDVKELIGPLNGKTRTYRSTPNVTKYTKKLGMDPKKIKVLDPFGGAGNLIFPASQFGLDVTISDYNPLAHMIERSVLEFPARYGQKLVDDFTKYANQVIEMTKKECGKFFQDNQLTYLWCWCIKCPHCEQRVPLTNQMYIARTTKKKIGIKFIPKNKNFRVELVQNISEQEGKKFTQRQGTAKCISCTNTINYESLTKDISKRRDRELIAIQIQKKNGRDYVIATEEDKKIYHKAVKYFESKRTEFEKENLIPKENIYHDPRSPLKNYGINYWDEFFDERQLLVLCTFLKNIREVCSQIKDKEYQGVIALYLAGILAKRVDMSGLGVQWNSTGEKPEHVLTLRRPSIVLNFVEANPFEKIRGSITNAATNIVKGISLANTSQNPPKCYHQSVTESHESKYDIIMTDPPYGDDVQYGELSEFFYVWVYRALKNYFPKLPARVNLDEDFCESKGRFDKKELSSEFFAKGLKKSFTSMREKLKDDGLLVVFFAHSSTDVWNLFLESVRAAKMEIVSSYTIHTEMRSNVLARAKASFMSSIVVTCRKLNSESTAFFEELSPQIEDRVKELLKQIPDEKLLTIPITDLLIMVYGEVLEVCTKHTTLKSHQKNFKPNFETLISGARDYIMKELVIKITGKSINTIGPRMAFYLLIKMFHRGIVSGDDANNMAKIYNIDIVNLEKEQVLIKEKGIIRTRFLYENEMDYSHQNVDKNNLFQQISYLCYTLNSKNSDKVPGIISQDNFRVEEIKQIISLFIKNYQLRQNKGESLEQKEQDELNILKNLGDILGVKVDGPMDSYLEK